MQCQPRSGAGAELQCTRRQDPKLVPVAEAKLGHWCQGAGWTPNGATVLAQCIVEREIQMFGFDGKSLKAAGAIKVNGGPGGLRTAR